MQGTYAMRSKDSRIRCWLISLTVLVLLPNLALAQGYGTKPQTGLVEAPLVIKTATGASHEFTVEIAQTPRQQAIGMMFRTHVPANRGMLFPFAVTKPTSFWMKNTVSSLDLLFIRADGVIADIHSRAEPLSLDPITSPEPVAAVLEIAGGEADRRDIRAGDRIIHAFFE
jgi:uncharacterized protein